MPKTVPATFAALLLAGPLAAQEAPGMPFLCDDGSVVRVAFADGSATVAPGSRDAAALEAAPSGSGFRYEGAAGVLTGQGEEISWAPAAGAPRTCRAVPGGAALVGPVWEVVRFEPAGDAAGALQPADPAALTVVFEAAGRAALGLDCNRGTGAWSAAPAGDGLSGPLEMGPVASTRALCGGGDGLADRLAGDLGEVVSFAREGDALELALRDGAGVWTLRARD